MTVTSREFQDDRGQDSTRSAQNNISLDQDTLDRDSRDRDSREFRNNVEQDGSSHGSAVAVEATGVIMTARNLGNSMVTLAAHGEIDVRSAPEMTEFARSHVAAGTTVVLDLTDVGFFGIAGLAVFDALDSACAAAGAQWVLCGGRPVSRLVQASGRGPSVRSFTTVDDALTELQ